MMMMMMMIMHEPLRPFPQRLRLVLRIPTVWPLLAKGGSGRAGGSPKAAMVANACSDMHEPPRPFPQRLRLVLRIPTVWPLLAKGGSTLRSSPGGTKAS